MERTLRKIAFIGSLACLTACDKGFDEMNVNPVALTGVDPVFQLNNAIVNSAFTYGNLSYETTIVKQMITPFSGVGSAANYNQDNRGVAAGNWQRYYRSITRDLIDIVEKTRNDANRSNLYHIARIWKAYCFMLLTDTYGDVPYREAGRGALPLPLPKEPTDRVFPGRDRDGRIRDRRLVPDEEPAQPRGPDGVVLADDGDPIGHRPGSEGRRNEILAPLGEPRPIEHVRLRVHR